MAAKGNRKQAGQAPISSHPAFPAIVALWFASLFGIGSMVLPVVLLEKLVAASGIASLVPAAAPPLGGTARILIALVAAGLGVALGIVLARRVATAQTGQHIHRREPSLRAVDAHPDAPVKWPISAREELGSDTLDEPFDSDSFDELDYTTDPQFAELMPGHRRDLPEVAGSESGESLDDAPPTDGDTGFAPVAGTVDDEDALELEYVEPDAMPAHTGAYRAPSDTADEAIRDAGLNTSIEPQSREGQEPAPGEAEIASGACEMPELAAPEAEVSAQPQEASPTPGDGPLAELSIAQLVDRFALALQAKAAEAERPQPLADLHEERDLTVPQARRPLDLGQFADDEDDDDGAAGPEPVVAFPNQQDRREGHPAAGAMPADPFARPTNHGQPFDAPSTSESVPANGNFAPAAPANSPVDRAQPDETEKALRDALEKLQRMSGAA